MSSTDQFDWVAFYKDFALKLLQFKNGRDELVKKVLKIYDVTGIHMPTLEKDKRLEDIDPFTVFGLFNKSSMRESNRIKILSAVAALFGISAPVPTSFDSIPMLNNQNAIFYYFVGEREGATLMTCGNSSLRLLLIPKVQRLKIEAYYRSILI